MSEKRKDNKGRILRTGESQRKDGTYMYRYTDLDGKRKYVYEKDLNELRNLAKQIQKTIDDGLNYSSGNITFLQLYDIYVGTKHNVKPATLYSYRTMRNILTNYPVANKEIKAITVSDINTFVEDLSQCIRTTTLKRYITTYKSVLAFAVEMDMIKKNPFKTRIVCNCFDENYDRQRLPLTSQQKENLLTMLYDRENKYYYYFTKFILLTGLRLGETLGITWNDVDFKNRKLKVSRQIVFVGMELLVSDTKSRAGHREIYLYNELLTFLQELKSVNFSDIDVLIDGYHNFIFANKGKIRHKAIVDNAFRTIRKQYEKKYGEYVYITPHVLRHTFCTDMIKSGVNIKTVQYLMGHSDVSMTLDIYTHTNFDDVSENLKHIVDR